MLHGAQGARIQAVGKRVVDQPARHAQHLRAMHLFDSKPLKRTQVIDVSQFLSQFFKDCPVPVASRNAIPPLQVLPEIILHTIVVDEHVIDIEEEDNNRRMGRHVAPFRLRQRRIRLLVELS
jgi:hypothetical protein